MAESLVSPIRLLVVGHEVREAENKPCGWGPARSSAETTQILEFYVRLRHGQAVQVEYRDLADPQVQAGLPDLYARAEAERLPYPLIVIDDQLEMAGSAQYYDVLPLVEQALLNQGLAGGD